MKINNLKKLIQSGSIHLKDSCVIEIIGDKDKVFDLLQGQVTSDIKLLEDGQSQLSCICNHKGMIMADFIIIFDDECYKLVVKENIEDILNDAFENIRIIVLEVLKNDALGNE